MANYFPIENKETGRTLYSSLRSDEEIIFFCYSRSLLLNLVVFQAILKDRMSNCLIVLLGSADG